MNKEEFKVMPRGIVKMTPLEDSRNPNAISEEIVIPREIFIEAYMKFIGQIYNKRMKQYEREWGYSYKWYYEENPDYQCDCGCGFYRYEYDEYNDKLYILCKDCGYVGEVLPSAYRTSILNDGYWRYDDNRNN